MSILIAIFLLIAIAWVWNTKFMEAVKENLGLLFAIAIIYGAGRCGASVHEVLNSDFSSAGVIWASFFYAGAILVAFLWVVNIYRDIRDSL